MKKTFEDNLKEIEAFLASYKRNTLPHFINGATVYSQSGETFKNFGPILLSIPIAIETSSMLASVFSHKAERLFIDDIR